MKVQNQVCSLEQAKKLIELGVYAPSAFVYFKAPNHSGIALGNMYMRHIRILTGSAYEEKDVNITPAYTVAELGTMIDDFVNHSRRNGKGEWEAKFKPVIPHAAPHRIQDAMVATFTTHKTEAEARASLLIHLLETNWLDAEKCNERLSKFINS